MPSCLIAVGCGSRGAGAAGTASVCGGAVDSGWSVPVSGGSSLGMLKVKGNAPAGVLMLLLQTKRQSSVNVYCTERSLGKTNCPEVV